MSDNSNYVAALVGQAAAMGNVSDPSATVLATRRRTYKGLVSDAATAGTAVTETVLFQAARPGIVKRCTFAAPIAVTAHDTTYATMTVSKRTGSGAATVIATQTTKITGGSGNLTAFVPITLTLTASAAAIAADDVVTILISKASTGVALTAATSYASFTVDVEESI